MRVSRVFPREVLWTSSLFSCVEGALSLSSVREKESRYPPAHLSIYLRPRKSKDPLFFAWLTRPAQDQV